MLPSEEITLENDIKNCSLITRWILNIHEYLKTKNNKEQRNTKLQQQQQQQQQQQKKPRT